MISAKELVRIGDPSDLDPPDFNSDFNDLIYAFARIINLRIINSRV